jgi:hypothetical protein
MLLSPIINDSLCVCNAGSSCSTSTLCHNSLSHSRMRHRPHPSPHRPLPPVDRCGMLCISRRGADAALLGSWSSQLCELSLRRGAGGVRDETAIWFGFGRWVGRGWGGFAHRVTGQSRTSGLLSFVNRGWAANISNRSLQVDAKSPRFPTWLLGNFPLSVCAGTRFFF